jgi:uroporphyrinogen decarboxylase
MVMPNTSAPAEILSQIPTATHGRIAHASGISSRQKFLSACRGEPLESPPVWLMRQAGRALPEYRKLRERYSFLELVKTPELAAEVTLQPIHRFGFDAAILFSDILVIPEAMGQGYHFRDSGGVEMDFKISTKEDIENLSVSEVAQNLYYVSEALDLIKPQLKNRTALIGFAGSPWTLANFMLEGGSCRRPTIGLHLLKHEPEVFRLLVSKLTAAIIEFLRLQIRGGVDVVQIFDSHGGLLPENLFEAGSGLWMKRIIQSLKGEVPVIVFSKGTRSWKSLAGLGAQVIGIDHEIPISEARRQLPETLALQGNLDPSILAIGDRELVCRETLHLLESMKDSPGWIFNLGHGVPPGASLENIAAMLETIRSFS